MTQETGMTKPNTHEEIAKFNEALTERRVAEERERCARVVHNLQQRLSDRAKGDAGYVFAFNDAIREAVAAIRNDPCDD